MNNIISKFKDSKKITLSLAVVFFLLFNWLSSGLYLRADLSATGRYKLTSASKKIIRNLPEKVTIEAYFSRDISEAYYQPVKQLRDYLQEYAAASRGKIKLVFLNPDEDEEIQQKARTLGIQPMPIGSVDQKKREVSRVYLSLALYYEDQTQVIPDILRQSQALEYFLTANIFKMAYPMERKIGYLASNSPFTTTQQENPFYSMDILNKSLSTFYGDISPVSASTGGIPSDISVLLIMSPSNLSEIEKYNIDQFILRGGKIILAMNGVDINFQNLSVVPRSPDILDFFANYGVKVNPDMVFDSKNYIPFRQPVNMLQVMEIPYPVWLVSPEDYLIEDNILTENFKFLVFPWASSLTIDASKVENGENYELAKTSTLAWSKSEQINVSPEVLKNSLDNMPPDSDLKQFTLAGSVKGKFRSYFNGRRLTPEMKNFVSESTADGEILAISTPFVFTNNIQPIHISQNLNINFFLTIIDTMNGLDELVKSRNRSQPDNPALGPVDLWVKNMVSILNFGLPLLFIIGFGIFRFISRRKIQQEVYNPDIKSATGESND